MSQITALTATLEATTGVSIGQLVGMAGNIAALAGSTNTVQTVQAVTQLVNGVLDIAVSIAKAAGAAASVLQVVPVLGQLIGIMMDLMVFFLKEAQRYKQAVVDCQTQAEDITRGMCQQRLTWAKPLPTEAQTAQPSDVFRPVWTAMKEKKPLPISPASLYVMMCGGETRGEITGALSRSEWRDLVERYKKKSGNKRIGIPQSIQRKMWSLIKGIMSGVNYPQIGAPVYGDNGRALMPILQDIAFNLHRVGSRDRFQLPSRGDNFGIDRGFMMLLSRQITTKHYFSHKCPYEASPGMAKGATPEGAASCHSFIDLADPWLHGIKLYENALKTSGLLRNDGTWNLKTYRRLTSTGAHKALLVIRGKALAGLRIKHNMALNSAMVSTLRAAAETREKRENDRKAAIATTSVILGGGAFWAMRRLAKKR
jgi:hypothetical protein